jgi:hypothetical protein
MHADDDQDLANWWDGQDVQCRCNRLFLDTCRQKRSGGWGQDPRAGKKIDIGNRMTVRPPTPSGKMSLAVSTKRFGGLPEASSYVRYRNVSSETLAEVACRSEASRQTADVVVGRTHLLMSGTTCQPVSFMYLCGNRSLFGVSSING